MTDYSQYLELLKTQIWYFRNLMNKRGQFKDEAMVTSISKYWPGLEDRSPLELAYHAISPLNQVCDILENPELEWGDNEIDRLEIDSKSEEFLDLYELVLTKAEKQLKNAEISKFKGNMEEVGKDPAVFLQRLKIFCMHMITHYGQAIKFHGMICHSLENDS